MSVRRVCHFFMNFALAFPFHNIACRCGGCEVGALSVFLLNVEWFLSKQTRHWGLTMKWQLLERPEGAFSILRRIAGKICALFSSNYRGIFSLSFSHKPAIIIETFFFSSSFFLVALNVSQQRTVEEEKWTRKSIWWQESLTKGTRPRSISMTTIWTKEIVHFKRDAQQRTTENGGRENSRKRKKQKRKKARNTLPKYLQHQLIVIAWVPF